MFLSSAPLDLTSFAGRKWLEALVTILNGALTTLGIVDPCGSIIMFGGAVAPNGYLMCDGSAVSRITEARLFAIIGTAFGAGDGSTTFNLPNFQQRFPLGKAATGTGNSLGATGGSVDHTHSVPAHYHEKGTGADLAVAIDHDHASFDSASTDLGSKTSGTASADHTHLIANDATSSTALSDSNYLARSYNAANDFSYDLKGDNWVNKGKTSANGWNHTHSTSIGSHKHSVDVPSFSGSGSVSGKIGLVTGGVDGNAAMTSGTNNPPFQVVNYIIKT